jgi:hypothetical protein
MSDLSFEIPEPEDDTICCDCGSELSEEELDAGREMCFDCYCVHQGMP